ncbi:MAG TPA: hypothetical protein VMU12_01870, partial [Candidatus Paceibacterota bacterium]|nr:hypothetical protein [Candidatus Paceibacterota bacterium]
MSNQAQNTLTQYTGLRLSDILKATGNDSANQKLCQAQNVLGALDNIIGNFKNFITDEVNVFMQAFMANVAKSLIYCTLSDIQKEVGVSFIVNGKLLIRTQPQCNLSIASDAAAAALNIQAQQLKQNFLGRCSAAASLNDIFANIDQVINDQGPNGGTAAVTNWVNNLYTEPDRQGMRRMWTILVNTDICPYFREQALDYFGVPQS